MIESTNGLLSAGTVDEIRKRGCTVVTGSGHTIAVFTKDDTFAAVDNRCPHMGFPLDRGTVKNGILTCHWHHARFDLASGGTFDPFADDVRSFPVTIIDNTVYVDPNPPEQDPVERWSKRLNEGMEDNIRLVIAKSVLGINSSPADYRTPADHRRNLRHYLLQRRLGVPPSACSPAPQTSSIFCGPDDRPLALYQGLRQVATECAGQPAALHRRTTPNRRNPTRNLQTMVQRLHRSPRHRRRRTRPTHRHRPRFTSSATSTTSSSPPQPTASTSTPVT